MKFWRAIGLGIFLIVLAIAMPRVFGELEETLLAILQTLQGVLTQAESMMASPAPLTLPSVR